MHTRTINLPVGAAFDIYAEEIPHKTTIYGHSRTMIFSARRATSTSGVRATAALLAAGLEAP
jgi:hypothetical protein